MGKSNLEPQSPVESGDRPRYAAESSVSHPAEPFKRDQHSFRTSKANTDAVTKYTWINREVGVWRGHT